MPELVPFRGIRYRSVDVSSVAAPPYDVIDPDQRVALAARDPHNAVRLILPEGTDRYAAAARLFTSWRSAGVLGIDDEPAFYVNRMTFTDHAGRARTTTGVLGALTLPERAGDGDVLPHERTLPKAKSDRLQLLRATRANFDPIWGLSLASGLSALLDPPGELVARAVDDEGVHHECFRLATGTADALVAAIAPHPLVLADGHHRFETAIAHRDERRAQGRETAGDRAILCFVVELVDRQVEVGAIHRLLHGLPAGFALRDTLASAFDVEPVGPGRVGDGADGTAALLDAMREFGALGLVDAAGCALLHPRPSRLGDRGAGAPGTDVDAARFEVAIAPRLPVEVEVEYRHDAVTCAALVGKGAVDAAVLLRPATVAELRAAAEARERMPQKTTFFEPKPRTGLVFRGLDD